MIKVKQELKSTMRYYEALKLLSKKVPDLAYNKPFYHSQFKILNFYSKKIIDLEPDLKFVTSNYYCTLTISKTFKYKIDNENFTFIVNFINPARIEIWYDAGFIKPSIRFVNLHRVLRGKFSKEFIDRIVKESEPYVLKALASQTPIYKKSFIPKRLKNLINFV